MDRSVRFIGFVRSELRRREEAPKQGPEGGLAAWLEIAERFIDGVEGITCGDQIVLLTWLHQGNRNVLKVHPRGKEENAATGVFSTRSPDRPNPIGLHRVTVLEIAAPNRIKVYPLEAIDGTPIIDIKPVLPRLGDA